MGVVCLHDYNVNCFEGCVYNNVTLNVTGWCLQYCHITFYGRVFTILLHKMLQEGCVSNTVT